MSRKKRRSGIERFIDTYEMNALADIVLYNLSHIQQNYITRPGQYICNPGKR